MFGCNVKAAKRPLEEALAVVSRSIATQSVYIETNQAVSRKFRYSSAFLSIISYSSTFFSSSRRVKGRRSRAIIFGPLRKLDAIKGLWGGTGRKTCYVQGKTVTG